MHLAPSLRCIWLKIYIITAHGTSWNIYCWYEAIHSRNWNPHVYDKTEWFLFLFSLVFGFHNPFHDHKASFSMASTGISSSLPGAPKGSGKHQSSEVTEIDCLKCLKWLNCEKKWIAHHESHMPPSSIQVTPRFRGWHYWFPSSHLRFRSPTLRTQVFLPRWKMVILPVFSPFTSETPCG
jgi:hypothetical protein